MQTEKIDNLIFRGFAIFTDKTHFPCTIIKQFMRLHFWSFLRKQFISDFSAYCQNQINVQAKALWPVIKTVTNPKVSIKKRDSNIWVDLYASSAPEH